MKPSTKKHLLSISGGTLSVIAGIAAPVAVVSSSSKYQKENQLNKINATDVKENINNISQDLLIQKRDVDNFVKLKKNFPFLKKGIFLKIDLKIKIIKDASKIGHLRNGDKILLSATPKTGFRFSDGIAVITREITIAKIGENIIPTHANPLPPVNIENINSLTNDLNISDYQAQKSLFFKAINTNKILIQNNSDDGFKAVNSFYSIKLPKNSKNKIELKDSIKKYFKSKLSENVHIEISDHLAPNFNSKANEPEEQFIAVSLWNQNNELHSDPCIIFVQTLDSEKGNIIIKKTGFFQKNNSFNYDENSNQPDYIKNDYDFNSNSDIPTSIDDLEKDVNEHFESSSGRITLNYLGSKKMDQSNSRLIEGQFNYDKTEIRSYLFAMIDEGVGVQNNENAPSQSNYESYKDVKLLQILHADKIIFSKQPLNDEFKDIVANQSKHELQLFRNKLTEEQVESIIKNNFKSIHGSQLEIEWLQDYNGDPSYKDKIINLKIKTLNNEIVIPETINYVVEILEADPNDQILASPKKSSSYDVYNLIPCQEDDADFEVEHQESNGIILEKAINSLVMSKTGLKEKISIIDSQTILFDAKVKKDSNGNKISIQNLSLSYIGDKTGLKKTVNIKFISKIIDEPSINFKENSSIGGTILEDGATIFHKTGKQRTIEWYKEQIKANLVAIKADNSIILIDCNISDSKFEKMLSSEIEAEKITFTAKAFGFSGRGKETPEATIKINVQIINEFHRLDSDFAIDGWPGIHVKNKLIAAGWQVTGTYLKINNYKYKVNQNDLSETEKNDIKKQINWYRDDQININIKDDTSTFNKQMKDNGYVEYIISITNDKGEIREIELYVYK